MAQVSAQPLCGLQMLRYKDLMQQLEIGNLRELEDLLITECFYGGIISGKLDQRAGCLHVHSALGRDVRPQQLRAIRQGLERWYVHHLAGMACRSWLLDVCMVADCEELGISAKVSHQNGL